MKLSIGNVEPIYACVLEDEQVLAAALDKADDDRLLYRYNGASDTERGWIAAGFRAAKTGAEDIGADGTDAYVCWSYGYMMVSDRQ